MKTKTPRRLKIGWEDPNIVNTQGEFYSDKNNEDSWLKGFLESSKVVFNYSEFNPRTKETGSDEELEEPITNADIELDRLAKNMDGLIGYIVDYHVSAMCEGVQYTEPHSHHDYVIIDINGTRIEAGFDEVLFTERTSKDQPRVVDMDVYVHMYEEKVRFLKEAYIAAVPAEIARYGNSESTDSLIEDLCNGCMNAIIQAKKYPYQLSGSKKVTVDNKYRGRYLMFINKNGDEIVE